MIPHRYNLYKWKLCNTPLCEYDNDMHDSIHLFLYCEQSNLFWQMFNDLVKVLYNVYFTFNVHTLIKGYNLENKNFTTLNVLIMYAKYAVYATFIYSENRKVIFNKLSIFSVFKRLVRNRLEIEKYCKDKSLCVFKNTLIEDNTICFI